MSQAETTAPKVRWGGRRRWLLAMLVLLTLGLASLGYYFFGGRLKGPLPPEVALTGADPDVVRVIQRAREEVVHQPKSAAAWGRLGEVLLANGYDPEAITCLGQAERLDPGNPRWPYLRACRLLLRDRESGIPPLRRAAELCDQVDPENQGPRLFLAQALIEKGELQEAKAQLQRVLERQPNDPRAHLCLGLVSLADADIEKGELQEAKAHFLHAVNSPYTQKKACAQLATVYQRLGDNARSEELTRREKAVPPDRQWDDPYQRDAYRWKRGRQARFMSAEQLELDGRLPQAIQILQEAARDYHDYQSYVRLGIALAKTEDADAAELVLLKAARLEPDRIKVQYALTVVLLKQGERLKERGDAEGARQKFLEAVTTARKGIEVKPDHAFCRIYLGLALKHLGRFPEAIAAFQKAVRCRPDLVDPHLRLGEALVEAGQRDAGLKCLKTAADLASEKDNRPREALARLGGQKE